MNNPKDQTSDFFSGPFENQLRIEWPSDLLSLMPQEISTFNCETKSDQTTSQKQKENQIKKIIPSQLESIFAADQAISVDLDMQDNNEEIFFGKIFMENEKFAGGAIGGRLGQNNYD